MQVFSAHAEEYKQPLNKPHIHTWSPSRRAGHPPAIQGKVGSQTEWAGAVLTKGLKPEKQFSADRNIYLRGKTDMVSDINDRPYRAAVEFVCPLLWFIKTEGILTSDKPGKAEITLKNDKQMED